MINENEKAKLGAKTFQDFCHQFGNDVYVHVLLEELFEGIINAETLFVFGESQQAGDQIDNGASRDGDSELRPGESVGLQTATDMGETDRPPYP